MINGKSPILIGVMTGLLSLAATSGTGILADTDPGEEPINLTLHSVCDEAGSGDAVNVFPVQGGQACCGSWGWFFKQHATELGESAPTESLGVKRQRADQQLVEQDAQ